MVTMKNHWKAFLVFMKRNKEGAIVGSAVGMALFFYIKNKGIDMMAAASQKGLLDVIMSRSSPLVIADANVLVTCVLSGLLIGVILDALIKPGK